MSDSIVYLFADTNLFLQCRPLEELNWSTWSTFAEVRLIVSSPVLREIDYRKNKGNDRVGIRARTASAMFRAMISSGSKIVREINPRVVLFVEPHHQHSKDIEHRLNYQERDDQLIGTIYEFAKAKPDVDVRLLTHDTTPLYTARGLDLRAEMIPDNWLLPPENTDLERELVALRNENTRLKKTEPSFKVWCRNSSDADADRYEASYTRFHPLTDVEIDALVLRMRTHFPMATNFGPSEPMMRDVGPPGFRIAGMKEEFKPATFDEIAKYRNEDYPAWLDAFKAFLRGYHQTLQRQEGLPVVEIFAENTGTRPASDALITIEAKGNFLIRPPQRDDRDDDIDGDEEEVVVGPWQTSGLSRPPMAPHGRWRPSIGGTHPVDVNDLLKRSLQGVHGANILDRPYLRVPLFSKPPPHDPNAFYFKDDRPTMAARAFSLKCDQWRHKDGEMTFPVEIHFEDDQKQIAGAVTCRIQAENLSQSELKLIPVQILISGSSCVGRATELVDALTSPQWSAVG